MRKIQYFPLDHLNLNTTKNASVRLAGLTQCSGQSAPVDATDGEDKDKDKDKSPGQYIPRGIMIFACPCSG